MKANYHNLKIADWNFDYSREQRFEIRGSIVELPVNIADKFPQFFKRIEEELKLDKPEETKIVTEVESENLVNSINEENLKVVTEPEIKYEENLTLAEKFLKALNEKEVKETKKNYEWNGVKISKDAYIIAENKEEFLFELFNNK